MTESAVSELLHCKEQNQRQSRDTYEIREGVGENVWGKIWIFIRSILTLERFDLFLQGTLFIITLLDGYVYLLLRRSAQAGELDHMIEDWVLMGSAVAEVVFGALLAWYGRGRRHLALSSWLLATAVTGLLILAFPQPEVQTLGVELCSDSTSWSPVDVKPSSISSLRVALIITTAVLCALARISIWAHGITYLDDHDTKNGPYFYGILISIRISVGINARSWFVSLSKGEDWWKGQLSFSMLTLMFAILFTLFPKRMPAWGLQPVQDHGDGGFLKTLNRLIRNKVLMIQIFALALLNAGVWGFIFNESDFSRARYLIEDAPNWSDGRNSRVVGDILRTFVIVFFVAIFRARFSTRRAEGVKSSTSSKVGGVLAIIVAVMFAAVALLHCGGAVQGASGEGRGYQQPACSQNCGCNSEEYGFAPVCTLDSLNTFFSPCHAGCSEYEDIHGFVLLHNCSCGNNERAVRGACTLDTCTTSFTIYQIVYINALAISAASLLMQGMVLLRAVEGRDKPTSIGLAFGVVGFIAFVPGYLMYMYISESTCAYKHSSSCLLHSDELPPILAGVTAALALLSGILSVIAFLVSRSQTTKT